MGNGRADASALAGPSTRDRTSKGGHERTRYHRAWQQDNDTTRWATVGRMLVSWDINAWMVNAHKICKESASLLAGMATIAQSNECSNRISTDKVSVWDDGPDAYTCGMHGATNQDNQPIDQLTRSKQQHTINPWLAGRWASGYVSDDSRTTFGMHTPNQRLERTPTV